MSTIIYLLRGQMSSPVNHLGVGQMSSYTIFHRGKDVRGGKCPAPRPRIMVDRATQPPSGNSFYYYLYVDYYM